MMTICKDILVSALWTLSVVFTLDVCYRMIQSLRSEAIKSEDIFAQLQEIQESVRLSFLNRFLDLAGMIDGCFLLYVVEHICCFQLCSDDFDFVNYSGHLERVGSELGQNKLSKESPRLQCGNSTEPPEELSSDLPGVVVDPHRRLLIVLSNIGYCKDELSSELYNKYKHIWLQPGYVAHHFTVLPRLLNVRNCYSKHMLDYLLVAVKYLYDNL